MASDKTDQTDQTDPVLPRSCAQIWGSLPSIPHPLSFPRQPLGCARAAWDFSTLLKKRTLKYNIKSLCYLSTVRSSTGTSITLDACPKICLSLCGEPLQQVQCSPHLPQPKPLYLHPCSTLQAESKIPCLGDAELCFLALRRALQTMEIKK